jgi:geranylgeranyl pyrophosphate synthase
MYDAVPLTGLRLPSPRRILEEIAVSQTISDLKISTQNLQACVEASLRYFVKDQSILRICMATTVRGRKLRPLLAILSSALCKGSLSYADLLGAASLEIFTAMIVTVDDIFDRSNVRGRRGVESLSSKAGARSGSVVGALLGEVATSLLNHARPTLDVEFVKACAEMASEEIESSEHKGLRDYLTSCHRKSGISFRLCTQVGTCGTSSSNAMRRRLNSYATTVGVLDQLADDYVDFALDRRRYPKKHQILHLMECHRDRSLKEITNLRLKEKESDVASHARMCLCSIPQLIFDEAVSGVSLIPRL